MDFFRRFFGSSGSNRVYDDNYHHDHDDGIDRTFEQPNEDIRTRGFQVFSDPLQMHQYFEHQMNEILKVFGFHGFDNGVFSEFNNIPIIEEGKHSEEHSGDLRDQFLKRGYEYPKKQIDKVDKDIDGKINLGDLDSVFGKEQAKAQNSEVFFGQIRNVKTIKHPDGTIETHRTIKDNEGNEEVTVCHKIEDKEYCIIKKKDKQGREEVTEKFVNLDENEKDKLFKSRNVPKVDGTPHGDFLFDRFFK